MESFDCFTKESITFMHSNGVLEPLMKVVLIKSCIEQITLDKNIEEEAIKGWREKLGLNEEESLQAWLKKNDMGKEDFKRLALNKIKQSAYSHQNFASKVDKKYLERKDFLDIVIYSLIRVKDPYLAREIYLRLVDKEACFGDLATLYSRGLESKTRGVIGPIELAKTHPTLIEIFRNCTPGVVQPPTQIEGLFVVTRLESLDESKLDKSMRKNMEEELFDEWIESESKTLVSNLLNQQKPQKLSE